MIDNHPANNKIMQTQLPAIRHQLPILSNINSSAGKMPPKYNISNLKLIRNPFERSRDFSVKVTDKVPEYNPLKDRYLQQFFRREQRIKLISIFANEISSDNQETIKKLVQSSKDKCKSSYQNLVDNVQYSSSRFLYKNKTACRKNMQGNPEQMSQYKKGKIITQPNEPQRCISISKDEFHSFLTKVKEKLRMKASNKMIKF